MSQMLGGGEIGQALAGLEYGTVPDVLAYRYATDPMKRIWSPEGSVVIERFLQIAIMQAQAELGVDIPQANIEDYRAVMCEVDLEAILEQERVTKHDVNARITVFNRLAGHQNVGEAMTSRDHTDNAEQLQKRLALEMIRMKVAAVVAAMARMAVEYSGLPITGRTHNVPAQMTTLGKRISMSGEELIDGYWALTEHIRGLKLRGIKGAVGTQQDMIDLLGSEEAAEDLDIRIMEELGFGDMYNSVGQIYPRSQDLATVQALSHVVGPISSFATNVRHMMGDGLSTESTKKRVGSNAMPHKINPRTSERIVAFYRALGGYEFMLRQSAGEQWLEGDVSDSLTRRIALPSAFFAADGALESGLTVLNDFDVFKHAIAKDVEANLPFLATTKILTTAISRGVGREDAHEIIRQHAFEVVKNIREKGAENDLLIRLGDDPRIPMSLEEIMKIIESPIDMTGAAESQVEEFAVMAQQVVAQDPAAANYRPGDIL